MSGSALGPLWWLCARVRCPWCLLTAEHVFTDGERRRVARSAEEERALRLERAAAGERLLTTPQAGNPNRKRADRFPPKAPTLVGEDRDEPAMAPPEHVERWCTDRDGHRYEVKEHQLARAITPAPQHVTEVRARRALY